MSGSCLVSTFTYFRELTDAECRLLEGLEEDLQKVPKGHTIRKEKHPLKTFFTLSGGWAYSYRNLSNGERQIIDIFVPGQIIGLREIAFSHSDIGIKTLTNAELCPFPKERLSEVFAASPELTDLFFLILSRDQAVLAQRIIAIGRLNADRRLAHFLLEMRLRLKYIKHEFVSEYRLPLSNVQIADALGMSPVHLSRTLTRLKNLGLIQKQHHQIVIRNEEGLKELADFEDRFLVEDLAWVRADRSRADEWNTRWESLRN